MPAAHHLQQIPWWLPSRFISKHTDKTTPTRSLPSCSIIDVGTWFLGYLSKHVRRQALPTNNGCNLESKSGEWLRNASFNELPGRHVFDQYQRSDQGHDQVGMEDRSTQRSWEPFNDHTTTITTSNEEEVTVENARLRRAALSSASVIASSPWVEVFIHQFFISRNHFPTRIARVLALLSSSMSAGISPTMSEGQHIPCRCKPHVDKTNTRCLFLETDWQMNCYGTLRDVCELIQEICKNRHRSIDFIITKTDVGTPYLVAWRQTVSTELPRHPSYVENGEATIKNTKRTSTSAVKSMWPGVSILIL